MKLERKWNPFHVVSKIIHEYGVEICEAFGGDEAEIIKNKFIKQVLNISGGTTNYSSRSSFKPN